MLILSPRGKKVISYNKKICECCEDKCQNPAITDLQYCCFDKVVRGVLRSPEQEQMSSVDCIREGIRNGIILLEIKNRKLSSLNIEEISRKIKETMQYLYEYETELFRPYNTKFFLVLPPDKYKLTSNSNGHFCKEMQSFSSYLVKLILRAFNDKNYPIKIEGQQYVLKSKIILCQNTDRFCI